MNWWFRLKPNNWSLSFNTDPALEYLYIKGRQSEGDNQIAIIGGNRRSSEVDLVLRVYRAEGGTLADPESYVPPKHPANPGPAARPPDICYGYLQYTDAYRDSDGVRYEACIGIVLHAGRRRFDRLWQLYASTTSRLPEVWSFDVMGSRLIQESAHPGFYWTWDGKCQVVICSWGAAIGSDTE